MFLKKLKFSASCSLKMFDEQCFVMWPNDQTFHRTSKFQMFDQQCLSGWPGSKTIAERSGAVSAAVCFLERLLLRITVMRCLPNILCLLKSKKCFDVFQKHWLENPAWNHFLCRDETPKHCL